MQVAFFEPSTGEHAPAILGALASAVAARAIDATWHTVEEVDGAAAGSQRRVTIDWDRRRASQGRAVRGAMEAAAAEGADVFADLYLDRSVDVTPPLQLRLPTAFVAHRLTYLLPKRRSARGRLRSAYARAHLRLLARQRAGFVVHSAHARDVLGTVVDPARIAVAGLPTGAPAYLDELPGPDTLRLVCPGSTRPERGADLLIRAVAAMPQVEACVLGRADEATRSVLDEVGDPRIAAADGYLDERAYWTSLAAASLVVLPYRAGYTDDGRASAVLVEALAAGRPLVVTRPVERLLPAGYPGAVVVEPDDVGALAGGLREALGRLDELTAAARTEGPALVARDHSATGYFDAIVTAAGHH